jgi:Fe-S-cluster containining protein
MTVTRTAFEATQPIHVAPHAHHTCRMCAGGCRSYDVLLTEQEARRMDSSWWRPLLNNVPDDAPLVILDSATNQYTLNRVEDRCVFLDTDNLCVVHKSAGVDAKPLACQIFPFHAVQTPDGLNLSLNVSCRRLVEMTDSDAPLDTVEAVRLLSQTQAVATLGETVALTPDIDLTYADYAIWKAQLIDILAQPAPNWAIVNDQMRTVAALLLMIPGTDTPTNGRALFRTLHTHIGQPMVIRSTLGAIYRRAEAWLDIVANGDTLYPPAIESSGAPSTFFAQIAGQWLAGDQVALHRTTRTGWTALLAAFIGGMYGALIRIENGQRPDIALNEATADAIDLWFSPAGQLALSEPHQQAFLQLLAQG